MMRTVRPDRSFDYLVISCSRNDNTDGSPRAARRSGVSTSKVTDRRERPCIECPHVDDRSCRLRPRPRGHPTAARTDRRAGPRPCRRTRQRSCETRSKFEPATMSARPADDKMPTYGRGQQRSGERIRSAVVWPPGVGVLQVANTRYKSRVTRA